MGGIPKTKKREEILSEMKKVTDGVVDVIVYPSAADKSKNRGFAFVEYESHRAAAMARRKLLPGTSLLWVITAIIIIGPVCQISSVCAFYIITTCLEMKY